MRRGNLRKDGATMEGRGKVSLASSFYSAAAAAAAATRRATEIDVDFSHSGRRSALTRERARFNQLPLLPPLLPSFLPSPL